MLKNSYMLDANAVLRFLLQDIEEQFEQVNTIIMKEKCYVTLEVMVIKWKETLILLLLIKN